MELDENQNEPVPFTLIPDYDQNYGRDSRHMKNTWRTHQTHTITPDTWKKLRPKQTTQQEHPDLRGQDTIYEPTQLQKSKLTFLFTKLVTPVQHYDLLGNQGDGTRTHSSQQQNSSENIRDSALAADDQHNSHQKSSKNIHLPTETRHNNGLVSRLRKMFENEHHLPHTHAHTHTHTFSRNNNIRRMQTNTQESLLCAQTIIWNLINSHRFSSHENTKFQISLTIL